MCLSPTWYNLARGTQEPYYKKSDGGGRLGYWNTSAISLETEVAALEELVLSVHTARASSPAAVALAEDALAGARWALKAVRLFAPAPAGVQDSKRSPAFADVSALLEEAVR